MTDSGGNTATCLPPGCIQPMKKLPGIDTLDDALLRAIAGRGGVRHYAAKAVLVSEDDHSDALYIILAGRVKVYGADVHGREIIYSTVGAGEYFGELTLDGLSRSANVIDAGTHHLRRGTGAGRARLPGHAP